MKKWLCTTLTLCLLALVLCGCGEGVAPDEPRNTTTTTAPTVSSTPLTESQLREIEAFLNERANNGLVGSQNLYTVPQQVDVHLALYDGGGIGTSGTTNWSEQEKRDVLAATGWGEYYAPPLKLKRADVDAFLQEKIGISLADVPKDRFYGFWYVEAYDAYYTMHGDTNYLAVTVFDGQVDGERYIVHYTVPYFGDYTVTLAKTANGYRFLSNTSIHKISYVDDTAASSLNNIRVQYPQVRGLTDPTVQAAVNDLIKTDMWEYTVQPYIDSYTEEGITACNFEFKVTLLNEELISIAYTGEVYVEGSARRNNEFYAATFDLQTGEKLALTDFVTVDEAFINKVKQTEMIDTVSGERVSRADVWDAQNTCTTDELIRRFTETLGRDYYNFYLTEDTLVVSVPVSHAGGDYVLITLPGPYADR